MAIGGGTPTFLNEPELEQLFEISHKYHGCQNSRDPHLSRSFAPHSDLRKIRIIETLGSRSNKHRHPKLYLQPRQQQQGRPQAIEKVYAALDRIKSVGFPTLNLDLIYGLPGQSIESWLQSLQIALTFAPEELYLYPLYIRPLTGLGRSKREWSDERRDYYRQARDLLLSAGYEQVSMRMFRLKSAPSCGCASLLLSGRWHGGPGLRGAFLYFSAALFQ